jgi:protein-L-isoaspartate(D-aspartate) O-methyltransferase
MFGRREKNRPPTREQMIAHQLEGRGIRDERVLKTMAELPRHEFVPHELRQRAYEDNPLPIGSDQTISQPYVVACMSELLALKGSERVLEIGAGCGYQTAVLAILAREVCAVELESTLVALARENLTRLGLNNVRLIQGDGFLAWPEAEGGFDAILCACAPQEVPLILCEQLARGGRLVLPVGSPGKLQELQCWFKDSKNNLTWRDCGAVRFVPMRGPRSLS